MRLSTSAQPTASAQRIWPSLATATDKPGRLSSTTSARARRFDSSMAPEYRPSATAVVEGTAARSGWTDIVDTKYSTAPPTTTHATPNKTARTASAPRRFHGGLARL